MLSPSGIFGVLAGLALLAAPAASIAVPTPADISARATYIGGVNVQIACIEQYDSTNVEARHDGNGAGDWYCFDTASGSVRGGVNMNAACVDQYGGGAFAQAPGGGIFDWGCYR